MPNLTEWIVTHMDEGELRELLAETAKELLSRSKDDMHHVKVFNGLAEDLTNMGTPIFINVNLY